MTAEELKPCPDPKCGSTEHNVWHLNASHMQITCKICACSVVMPTLQEAIAAWNARPAEALLREHNRAMIIAILNHFDTMKRSSVQFTADIGMSLKTLTDAARTPTPADTNQA